MTSNWWAANLFVGRIGEAVVESVLSEFGYAVMRSGNEQLAFPSGISGRTRRGRFTPDLLVRDPNSGEERYVEVKARSARPMAVILERVRFDTLQKSFPRTVLVFVSAWDGSVNCADVSQIAADRLVTRDGRFYEFDLIRRGWRPIWEFFPRVVPGPRLSALWERLRSQLDRFGDRRAPRKTQEELFDGERDALLASIERHWENWMTDWEPGARATAPDARIGEVWHTVRQMYAMLIVRDCFGSDLDEVEFRQFLSRAMGESGEHQLFFNIEEIRDALREYPERLSRLDQFLSSAEEKARPGGGPRFARLLQELLPPGVGSAILPREDASFDESIEVDLRTAVALIIGRNRLDVEP